MPYHQPTSPIGQLGERLYSPHVVPKTIHHLHGNRAFISIGTDQNDINEKGFLFSSFGPFELLL